MRYFKAVHKGYFSSGDKTINVYYYEVDAAGAPNANAVCTWLDTIWHAGLKSSVTNQWHSESVVIYEYTGGWWQYQTEAPYVWTGTAGTQADAQQLALVMTARTSGKRVVPKKFFPGVITADHDRGMLQAAQINALNTSGTAWKTVFLDNGQTCTPGTWTKSNTFLPLLAVRTNTVVGTQRRRKQGVGF